MLTLQQPTMAARRLFRQDEVLKRLECAGANLSDVLRLVPLAENEWRIEYKSAAGWFELNIVVCCAVSERIVDENMTLSDGKSCITSIVSRVEHFMRSGLEGKPPAVDACARVATIECSAADVDNLYNGKKSFLNAEGKTRYEAANEPAVQLVKDGCRIDGIMSFYVESGAERARLFPYMTLMVVFND